MKLSTLTARARLACFVLLAVLWYVLWPTTARAENRSAGPRATPLYQQEIGRASCRERVCVPV